MCFEDYSVFAFQAFARNLTEREKSKEHVKERAKEKEKDKKTQQKKKKVNDLERAGQKSGAPAYASKQVTTLHVVSTRSEAKTDTV